MKTKMKNIDPITIFGQLCDLAKFPLLTPYVKLKVNLAKRDQFFDQKKIIILFMGVTYTIIWLKHTKIDQIS